MSSSEESDSTNCTVRLYFRKHVVREEDKIEEIYSVEDNGKIDIQKGKGEDKEDTSHRHRI